MNELIKQTQMDHAKRALANPESAEQVKEIANFAGAIFAAHGKMKKREEEYYQAFEVMVEAYRIIGRELITMEKNVGGRPSETGPLDGPVLSTLKELGITKNQSSEWQSLALIPAIEIEHYVNARRIESGAPTKAALLDIAQKYKTADKISKDEANSTITTILAFCIQARKLTTHLKEFPDSRKAIPKEFFERLKQLEEITDELNRSTL